MHYHLCFDFTSRAKAGHRKTPPDGITCDLSESIDVRCSLPSWAQQYSFSGQLRPTLLSPKRVVPQSIRRPDYAVSLMTHDADNLFCSKRCNSFTAFSQAGKTKYVPFYQKYIG